MADPVESVATRALRVWSERGAARMKQAAEEEARETSAARESFRASRTGSRERRSKPRRERPPAAT